VDFIQIKPFDFQEGVYYISQKNNSNNSGKSHDKATPLSGAWGKEREGGEYGTANTAGI
jgi:hypothetical protein